MDHSPATRADPLHALAAAVRRRFGLACAVENIEQATLGGSNRTLLFDIVRGGTRTRLVSREETFPGDNKPFLPPALQFRVMALVHEAGLTIPEPVFAYDEADAMGPGFVTSFAAGHALPKRILADVENHAAIVGQLAGLLARLHALPVAPFAFLADRLESGDPVAAMRARIDALHEPHPALEFGLRWLERHPPPPRAACLVHGDFRTGNFLADGARVTALLDWECAHLGSPAEDIGWFCTRSWRFGRVAQHAGGLVARADFLAAYHTAGGAEISVDEVRWWEIFGLIRWAMFNMLQAYSHEQGRRSPAYALCGRNVALMEYDLLKTLAGDYD